MYARKNKLVNINSANLQHVNAVICEMYVLQNQSITYRKKEKY